CPATPPSSTIDVRSDALRKPTLALALLVGMVNPSAAHAQSADRPAFALLGRESEERLRLEQLRDRDVGDALLLRAPSRQALGVLEGAGWQVLMLPSELSVVANSALPYSVNDG